MNKKFKLLALAMALVLVLCSCGSKKEEFSYSNGINSEGFFEGIKATDYVTLPDLNNLGIGEEAIDDELFYLMNQEAYMKKTENTERTIEDQDTVNIDYVGYIDGVPFSGGDTQGMGTEVTIGVTSYIDGFLDQLIGHKVGENFDIKVTFPESYGNADLAGKDAVFNITVNALYDYEAYELTDNFVTMMFNDQYGVSTVEELRRIIKSSLAYDAIMSLAQFKEDLPGSVGDQYMARIKHDLQLSADSYQKTLDEYIAVMYSAYGMKNYDDYKEFYTNYYLPQAVKEELMLQAVAETKNIKVTDKDLESLFENARISYESSGMEFDKDDMIKVYGEPYIKQMALFDKVQEYFGTL